MHWNDCFLPFIDAGGGVLVAFDGGAFVSCQPESTAFVSSSRLADCFAGIAEYAFIRAQCGIPNISTRLLAQRLGGLTVHARIGHCAPDEEALVLTVRLTRIAKKTRTRRIIAIACRRILAYSCRSTTVDTSRNWTVPVPIAGIWANWITCCTFNTGAWSYPI